MSKKIIEQKGLPNISVHKLEYLTVLVQDGKAPVDIHKSNATTVAKAICLEYQKVIDEVEFLRAEHPVNIAIRNENKNLKDQNAKLVEALEEAKDINFDILCLLKRAIYFIDMTVAGYSSNLKQEIIKALQNNKKIEG